MVAGDSPRSPRSPPCKEGVDDESRFDKDETESVDSINREDLMVPPVDSDEEEEQQRRMQESREFEEDDDEEEESSHRMHPSSIAAEFKASKKKAGVYAQEDEDEDDEEDYQDQDQDDEGDEEDDDDEQEEDEREIRVSKLPVANSPAPPQASKESKKSKEKEPVRGKRDGKNGVEEHEEEDENEEGEEDEEEEEEDALYACDNKTKKEVVGEVFMYSNRNYYRVPPRAAIRYNRTDILTVDSVEQLIKMRDSSDMSVWPSYQNYSNGMIWVLKAPKGDTTIMNWMIRVAVKDRLKETDDRYMLIPVPKPLCDMLNSKWNKEINGPNKIMDKFKPSNPNMINPLQLKWKKVENPKPTSFWKSTRKNGAKANQAQEGADKTDKTDKTTPAAPSPAAAPVASKGSKQKTSLPAPPSQDEDNEGNEMEEEAEAEAKMSAKRKKAAEADVPKPVKRSKTVPPISGDVKTSTSAPAFAPPAAASNNNNNNNSKPAAAAAPAPAPASAASAPAPAPKSAPGPSNAVQRMIEEHEKETKKTATFTADIGGVGQSKFECQIPPDAKGYKIVAEFYF